VELNKRCARCFNKTCDCCCCADDVDADADQDDDVQSLTDDCSRRAAASRLSESGSRLRIGSDGTDCHANDGSDQISAADSQLLREAEVLDAANQQGEVLSDVDDDKAEASRAAHDHSKDQQSSAGAWARKADQRAAVQTSGDDVLIMVLTF
jgi:hypothetical protein